MNRIRKSFSEMPYWIIMVVFSVWTMFPFFWAIITSFKTMGQAYDISIIPFFQFKPSLSAWDYTLAFRRSITLNALLNSIVTAGSSAFLILLLASLAAFGLSRFTFERWKNQDIATWILSLRMFPPVVVVIPLFIIIQKINLLDTRSGLILLHTFFSLPIGVWLLKDFFAEIPKEVEEAAIVDGCSHLGVLLRITLPLAVPGLVAVYILCFILSWGEFLYAVTITYSQGRTLPVMIAGALSQKTLEFPQAFSLTLLAIIPPMVMGSFLAKYLVRGLTLGAVKG